MTELAQRPDHFPDVGHLAVALRYSDLGFHLGLLYRVSLDTPARIVHLNLFKLEDDECPSESWSWIPPDSDIDDILLRHIASLCETVVDVAGEGVSPFAFDMGKTFIDDNCVIVVGESGFGLTCSTFAIAIFRRAGIELIEMESWKDRDRDREREDAEAQEQLLLELRARDEKRANAIGKYAGCVRYRAEEVAVASGFGPRPMTYGTAVRLASDIRLHLIRSTSLWS